MVANICYNSTEPYTGIFQITKNEASAEFKKMSDEFYEKARLGS